MSCLDPGKFQTGSTTVTCSSGTEFVFEKEPSCFSPGILTSFISDYLNKVAHG